MKTETGSATSAERSTPLVTGISAYHKVGDLCPTCHWILTTRDFHSGRCGRCGFYDIPIPKFSA